MSSLTVEDCISIKIYVKELFDDYFIFDNQIIKGQIVFYIKGKPGSIPDDIADAIIEELAEYRYVCGTIDIMGFGNSVAVTGRGDE